jgi:hypothetical protein
MYVHWRGQGMCVYVYVLGVCVFGSGCMYVCVYVCALEGGGDVCMGGGGCVCMCMYWVWTLSGGGFTGRCMRRDGAYMLVCVLVL